MVKILTLLLSLTLLQLQASAQTAVEPANSPAEWSKPYPPFQIAGNLYYVGTYDLACYLITTPQGHILINTGLASSHSQIQANVETLGFKFSDLMILLTTQAHHDHVGAMASVKKATGAQLLANERDASVLADGGQSDYAFGTSVPSFEPVRADRLLHDGDTIALGGTKLVLLHHPGHTKGSSSYLVKVTDAQRTYRVLIANMPSIVTDKDLFNLPEYPAIAQDYAYTLAAMPKLSFDLWLSSHASQFDLHQKHQPGQPYAPTAFADRKGYRKALSTLQKAYNERVKSK